MNRKTAALLFVVICLVIAILLITQIIDAWVGGIIFAIALALLGVISGGFSRN